MEERVSKKQKAAAFFREMLPKRNAVITALLIATVVINIVFLCVASYKNEFLFDDVHIFLSFGEKLLFDAAFFIFAVLALKAVFRTPVVSALFVMLYFCLTIGNIGLYYFGNTLIEAHYFDLITPYSITGFFPIWGLVLIFILLIAVFRFAYLGIKKIPLEHIFRRTAFWLVICLVLSLVNSTGLFQRSHDEKYDRVITGFRNAQIIYVCQNQWIGFLSDVIFPSFGRIRSKLSPSVEKFVNDYNLLSEDFKTSENVAEYEKTISEWKLDVGRKELPAVGEKSYRRIIYVFTESLSLAALPCYNNELKAEFADKIFCSKEYFDITFSNLFTVGAPTLQGLTVTFNSHPNFNIQEQTGHINSLPKVLQKEGFRPVFIRSASKYFANENLIFKNMGFPEIIGREDFYEDEKLRPYIYGWGLEDRLLYDKVVEYIKKNSGEKLFVAVLGTDSHPPHGQIKYKGLTYPKRDGLKSVDKKIYNWLNSIDRMDYDISEFIKKLDKEGLFDESTLIVISSDHSCPLNNVSQRIKGHPRKNLAQIPLLFITKQTLPETDYSGLASQIDIAPTILSLVGGHRPAGWWGASLFDPDRRKRSIGFDKGFIYLTDLEKTVTINLKKPENEKEQEFIDLFNTVFKEK